MADTNQNKGGGTQANQGNPGGQGNTGRSQEKQSQGGTAGVAQMAKDAASSVSHAASGALASAADQAKHAAAGVAGGMHSLAGTIREHAPAQGMLGTAAGSVADRLDSGSRYLERGDLSGMVDDVAGTIRRNPISSMLCCLGVGFVLGRVLSPHSSSRSY